jgi:hypothetical protein
MTRVLLIGRVEETYRLIAQGESPSTQGPPWHDIAVAVRLATEQISKASGWRLLDETGNIERPGRGWRGVDAVTVTTSAGGPLRVLLIGIAQGTSALGASIGSARRAMPVSMTEVVGLVSSDRRVGDVLSDDFEGTVSLIQELIPDAIVLVGGVDGGASEPVLETARAVAWACKALPELRDQYTPVVYAGNADIRQRVKALFKLDADFRGVDNVRPTPDHEVLGPLRSEVETLHRQRKMGQLPGLETLMSWSKEPVQSTATAFADSIRYLAGSDEINVVGVDVGGAQSCVVTVVDDQFDLVVRSDLGLSWHIAAILDHVPIEALLRWLPFDADPAMVRTAICNKALHSRTLPQTREDLLIEHAIAREIVRLMLKDTGPLWPGGWSDLGATSHLIVGSGGALNGAPDAGLAALILLDALQPVGVSSLALDKYGLMALSGSVARVSPLAAAELVQVDALWKLGTIVAPTGAAREGELALTCRADYQGGRSLQSEVAHGSLLVIPLPAGQTATLKLSPTRHFGLGLGSKGQAVSTEVEGGAIGVIIDARGRPLPLAQDPDRQRQNVQRWLQHFVS